MRKWKDIPVIIAVAIGAACNANLWTLFNMPIEMGSFLFTPDSALFVLYMYTVALMTLDHSPRQGKVLVFTSLAAIVISAIFEFTSSWASAGTITEENLRNFLFYVESCLGTLAGCLLIIWLVGKSKVTNKYMVLLSVLVVTIVIHTAFYFCGCLIKDKEKFLDVFVNELIGGTVLKSFFVLFSLLCYFVNQKWLIPDSGFFRKKGNPQD